MIVERIVSLQRQQSYTGWSFWAVTIVVATASFATLTTVLGEETTLNAYQMHEVLSLAEFAYGAYPAKQVSFALQGSWLVETPISDPDSGLDLCVYEWKKPDGKIAYVINVAGTEMKWNDIATDVGQANPLELSESLQERFRSEIGASGELVIGILRDCQKKAQMHYGKALEISQKYTKLAKDNPNVEVIFTGHSLGGGVSQFLAAKLGARAICFDSAALGKESLDRLTSDQRRHAEQNVLHVSLQDDPVFFLTPRISKSMQLGQVMIVPQSPEAAHVMPKRLMERWFMPSRYANPFERHSMENLMESLVYYFHSGEPIKLQTISEALDRTDKERIPMVWASPQGASESVNPRELSAATVNFASQARRIVVVGDDGEADWMETQLMKQLGRQNVLRFSHKASILDIRDAAVNFHAEVIVGTRKEWIAERTPNEYVVASMSTVRTLRNFFSSASTTIGIVRDSLHLANRSNLTGSQLRQVASLDFMFKDIKKMDPFDTKLAKGVDWTWRITAALSKDINDNKLGEFTLLRSEFLHELTDIVLEEHGKDAAKEGLGYVLNRLAIKSGTSKILANGMAEGALDVVKAMKNHIREGHLTADVIEGYCDAMVRSAWSGLGLALTGNAHVASAMGESAVQAGKVMRDASANWFKKQHLKLTGTDAKLFDNWLAQMKSKADQGGSLMSFEDSLREDGVNPLNIPKEYLQLSQAIYVNLQRNRQHYAAEPTRTITLPLKVETPTQPIGLTDYYANDDLARRVISTDRHQRIVIAGDGTRFRQIYEWAVVEFGKGNVRWVHKTTKYRLARTVHEHGAEVVIRSEYLENDVDGLDTVRRRIDYGISGRKLSLSTFDHMLRQDAVPVGPIKYGGYPGDLSRDVNYREMSSDATPPDSTSGRILGDLGTDTMWELIDRRPNRKVGPGGVKLGGLKNATTRKVSEEELSKESGIDFKNIKPSNK